MSINPNQPTRQFVVKTPTSPRPNQPFEQAVFYDTSGNPLIVGAGANALLTGYVAPSGSNITAADTVSQAIKKLDARLRAAGTPL